LGSYKYTLTLRISPQKEVALCNGPLGHRPPALRLNSGEPAARSGQARARDGPWVPRALFPRLDGAEGGLVMAHGGPPERQPRWPLRILEGAPEGSVDRGGKRRRSSPSGGNGGRRRSKAGSSAC
jgi:hypothetical protein